MTMVSNPPFNTLTVKTLGTEASLHFHE